MIVEKNFEGRFRVGDLVGHRIHRHLAGIILELEHVKLPTNNRSYRMTNYGTGSQGHVWKAWVQWNGQEETRDYVEIDYLIKLM